MESKRKRRKERKKKEEKERRKKEADLTSPKPQYHLDQVPVSITPRLMYRLPSQLALCITRRAMLHENPCTLLPPQHHSKHQRRVPSHIMSIQFIWKKLFGLVKD